MTTLEKVQDEIATLRKAFGQDAELVALLSIQAHLAKVAAVLEELVDLQFEEEDEDEEGDE